MKIYLSPGETLQVCFEDDVSPLDGVITVEFVKKGGVPREYIQVSADMPDDEGREGIIYRENFVTDEEIQDW